MRSWDLVLPADVEPQLATLIATWHDGYREWRGELGMVKEDAIVWQPYENGPSIGGILLHMADCDAYWINQIALRQPADPEDPAALYNNSMDQYGPNWPVPPRQPITWYFQILESRRAQVIKAIEELADPNARFQREKSAEFTLRWIVAHLVEHDSYHGGQVVLLHEMYKKIAK